MRLLRPSGVAMYVVEPWGVADHHACWRSDGALSSTMYSLTPSGEWRATPAERVLNDGAPYRDGSANTDMYWETSVLAPAFVLQRRL